MTERIALTDVQFKALNPEDKIYDIEGKEIDPRPTEFKEGEFFGTPVVAAAAGEGAVETPAADPATAAAEVNPADPAKVKPADETEPKNELFKALEMVIRTEKVGLKDVDDTFIKDPLDEKVLSEGVALFCKKYGGAPEAASKAAASGQGGGRRRTKRKDRKGAKKGSRSSKNHRKQSRRRKH